MRKTVLALFYLLIALSIPKTASAGLINGDFSSGFFGWMGEVENGGVSLLDPPPGAFTNNYAVTPTGEAVLSTTPNDIFFVLLFQVFTVDPPAPGESLILSYDLGFSISGGGGGGVELAQLMFPGGIVSLLGASSLDITALAGQEVELLFGIEDFDNIEDGLTLDNVQISGVAKPVPAPGTLALMWLGASTLLVAKRRRRSSSQSTFRNHTRMMHPGPSLR